MPGLIIRDDLSADQLRALARRERNGRTASRLLALANALSGMSRTEAAKAAGMDRQTLRDWVHRYNDAGVSGLHDRPKGHPKPKLTEGEEAALANVVFRGPDPDKDGVSTWTTQALADWIAERFGKRMNRRSVSRILRRNGFSHQKARPSHPQKDPKAGEAFQKGGSNAP
ncbi:IS630 family transposase [Jiella pacifica]|uniref:IS630 family transposase n=1 Tax=Jiella pacifica TaxID=2696469 RepID=A0A6N9TBV6_9HYPH|nr:IS630 family transposase [Jiella pacifica]NDW07715.1 IS630 family transposase [Jiella pacifica]